MFPPCWRYTALSILHLHLIPCVRVRSDFSDADPSFLLIYSQRNRGGLLHRTRRGVYGHRKVPGGREWRWRAGAGAWTSAPAAKRKCCHHQGGRETGRWHPAQARRWFHPRLTAPVHPPDWSFSAASAEGIPMPGGGRGPSNGGGTSAEPAVWM